MRNKNLSKKEKISKNEHQRLIKRVQPMKDDILLCRIGTLGRAIKCTLDFEFSIFVSLGLIRLLNSFLSDYVILCINSPLGEKWIKDNKVGGGTHTYKINLTDLPNMLIPLPPLKEQYKILLEINNAIKMLDKL